MKIQTTSLLLSALIVGCSGAQVSSSSVSLPSQRIDRIAIAPGSGVMGDAIAVELFNRGYTIVDSNEASSVLGRAGLQEYEITSSSGYSALRDRGINAVLVVKAVSGNDGTPESASIRVTDTNDGRVISAITWQNGWGGMRGSIADRVMRHNLTEAAEEIAVELDGRMR